MRTFKLYLAFLAIIFTTNVNAGSFDWARQYCHDTRGDYPSKILSDRFSQFEKVATLPKSEGTINLRNFEIKPPFLIMFGSEADGLSQELIDFSTKKVTIEMDSDVESLNLSVSVGIILNALMD